MPVLKTIVDLDTKIRFRNLAKAKGLSESEFFRVIIHEIIEQEQDSNQELVELDTTKTDLDRATVWMPSFLKEAARRKAKLKGMTLSRWVAALIQSNLMRLPVMTKKELAVLRSSNWELAAIGRNINQIARTLNEAFYKTEAVKLEKLTELRLEILENRAAIQGLIRASQNVWESD